MLLPPSNRGHDRRNWTVSPDVMAVHAYRLNGPARRPGRDGVDQASWMTVVAAPISPARL